MNTLVLERKAQADETQKYVDADGVVLGLVTPTLNEEYWAYRVRLTERQAVIGFPKFTTIGIGFAVEDEDWNTNLPWTVEATTIAGHIEKNKGDDAITRWDIVAAVTLIQDAVREDAAAGTLPEGVYVR